MAHNLTERTDGTVEYAFSGQKPWHGIGVEVAGAMNAEEAIRAASLGWTVSKRQMMTLDGVDCPEFFAIVRDDNSAPLGMVGTGYVPTQINEAFAFVDAVVGEAKAKYVSVGSIGGGKRIFIVAEMPDVLKIKGLDIVQPYLTFCHGHDGTLAHRLYNTAIRVVCQNTLNASLNSSKGAGFYARHTGQLQYRVEQAGNILGFANRSFALFKEQAEKLAAVVVSVQQVEAFIRKVFDIQAGHEEEASEQKKTAIDTVLGNFESGHNNNLPGIKGTAWSLLNAATEFFDHQAPAVTDTDDPERRFRSIMFNGGADSKQTALEAALELVK
jgi:phage/plasmid-like protein (TIGR03299 family)